LTGGHDLGLALAERPVVLARGPAGLARAATEAPLGARVAIFLEAGAALGAAFLASTPLEHLVGGGAPPPEAHPEPDPPEHPGPRAPPRGPRGLGPVGCRGRARKGRGSEVCGGCCPARAAAVGCHGGEHTPLAMVAAPRSVAARQGLPRRQ